MESTGEPSPLSAPMCPWCPGGLPVVLGLLPHRPALCVAVLAMHLHRAHPGPNTFSCSSAPGPLLAPLVLTSYCPPSWQDLILPFSVPPSVRCSQRSGSSGAPCLFLQPAFAPLFLPGCGCCAQDWTLPSLAESQEGRVGVSLVSVTRAPTHLLLWEC